MAMASGLVFLGKNLTVLLGQSRLCTGSVSCLGLGSEGRMSAMLERRRPICTVAIESIEAPLARRFLLGRRRPGGASKSSAKF